MTRINEVLYFVLYDLCKIKKTQNKSASVFCIGTPEWNRTTAHGSGGLVVSFKTIDITSFVDLWSQFWSHSLFFSSEKGLLYVC